MVAVTLENQPIATIRVLTKDFDSKEQVALFEDKKEFLKKTIEQMNKRYNEEFTHEVGTSDGESYINKDRTIRLLIFFRKANLSGSLSED